MLILFSVSICLEFLSVNHTSVNKNSELKVFKNVKLFGEISSNCLNNLFRTNVHNTIESC